MNDSTDYVDIARRANEAESAGKYDHADRLFQSIYGDYPQRFRPTLSDDIQAFIDAN